MGVTENGSVKMNCLLESLALFHAIFVIPVPEKKHTNEKKLCIYVF